MERFVRYGESLDSAVLICFYFIESGRRLLALNWLLKIIHRRHYYQNTSAIIFVVDSNDRERLDEVKDELNRMLSEDELAEAVLCVLWFAFVDF